MKLTLDNVDLLHSAVIVVDIQNDFVHEKGTFARAGNDVSLMQDVIPAVQSFLAQARQLGIPLIHFRTEHSDWTDNPAWRQRGLGGGDVNRHCRPGSWGADFYKVLPEPGEPVIVKHRYSGFMDTDLDLILRSKGIRTIALVGVATNVCVESTARDGYQKGYYVVVVEDCVGTLSKEAQQASLDNVRGFFGVVSNSKELEKAWRSTKQ